MSITLANLRTRTQRLLNDPSATTNTQAFYDEKINDAQRIIAEEVKPFQTTGTISSVSGTQTYNLPSDFLALYPTPYPVRYTNANSALIKPVKANFDWLANSFDDLTTATGDPTYYYITEKLIGFYEIPDYSGSSNITLYYFEYPDSLSNSGDVSAYADKWIDAIAYKAVALSHLKNERFDDALLFDRLYEQEVSRIGATTEQLTNSNQKTKNRYLG